MVIVDTSAILAVMLAEPDARHFARALTSADRRLLSAVSRVELTCVLEGRKGQAGRARLTRFLAEAEILVAPVTEQQADIACDAFRRFGKGRHPAGLNLGDCFAYALAKATGEPLLFKGDDFARTDIARAP